MTTEILRTIAVSLWVILLSHFLIIRNYQVFSFRQRLILDCHNWNLAHIDEIYYNGEKGCDAYDWFLDKIPSYPAMVFSFRKLDIENFASKELIDKLYNKDMNDDNWKGAGWQKGPEYYDQKNKN